MLYGRNVSKTQADFILSHLNLPKDEVVLGVFDLGLYRLLYITSARAIDVFSYKVTVEVAGGNIASITNSKIFGLNVTLRQKHGRVKTALFPVKPEEREEVLGLLDALKTAPAPANPIIDPSNEKRVLGVRVKTSSIGSKKDHERINKIAAKEKAIAKKEAKAAVRGQKNSEKVTKSSWLTTRKEKRAAEEARLQKKALRLQLKAQQELQSDRVIIVATLIDLLREHWLTLSMRHSQTVSNDGYNNYRIDAWISELKYFRDNVAMQKLDETVPRMTLHRQLDEALLFIFAGGVNRLEKGELGFNTPSTELATIFMNRSEITDLRAAATKSWGEGLDEYTLSVAYDQALSVSIRSLGVNASDPKVKYDIAQLDVVTILIFTLMSWLYNLQGDATSDPAAIALPTNPYDYEAYIANRLSVMGFTAQTTKRSGDYGVDVLAEKNGKTYAIQCKYYSSPVGIHAVQEIHAGQVYYKADYAAVVTNNTFTPAAKRLAATSKVLLLNDSGLESLNVIAGSHEQTKKQDTPATSASTDAQNAAEEVARKKQIADELITVILPTISNK